MSVQIHSSTHNVEEVEAASPIEEVRRQRPEGDYVLLAVQYERPSLEVRYGRPLPVQLIERYAQRAVVRAETEQLEDGSWYAEIRNFPGVWAQGASEEEALEELETVVQDWVLLKIQDQDRDLPIIDEIDLNSL